MTEELKGLIDKIQEEGVRAAEKKAKEIEENAQKKAGDIIREAQKKASLLIEEAKKNIGKTEESTKASLKQAARDLLLLLRKEINALLDRIAKARIQGALTDEELVRMITLLVKEAKDEDKKNILVSLNKEDLEKLEKGLFTELKDEIKKGITLRPSENIRGGFIISYDKGKSCYDFTDKALAEYISSHLKPKLAEALK